MKNILLGTAFAALLATTAAPAIAQRNAGTVIVIVDTDRIYRECTACVAAQAQLQGQITALQQRAQQLGQPLQTEAQSLEQAAQAARAQAPGAARTAAENALQQRAQALQTRQNTANQELAGREQAVRSTQANVLQQINAALNPIYTEVMGRRNATVALDTNATLARSNTLDVTNDVLALLNQRLTSVNVVPLPAPAGTPPAPQPPGR